jgi:double-strand break repair protein AddB
MRGLYAVAPGVDFPAALVAGLRARFAGHPPEALARTTVYVNTQRMRRRIVELFADGPPVLLPRLRLVTDIGRSGAADLPPAIPTLRRRLELARLVEALIATEPDLAPCDAAFDLATSLATLMDEMQGEGVGLDAISALDVADQSGHWARSQKFLTLVGTFLNADPSRPADPEARQRRMVDLLVDRWAASPPADPVIVAGSTGSRGTTARLMTAVARLPCGAVVLPGVDRDMPDAIWAGLTEPAPHEDHPQYRFAVLAHAVGTDPAAIPDWVDAAPPSPARNALVSLALRPAPVTDGWRRDGPALGCLGTATEGIALIEAPDPRMEALAVALRLRAALEDGQRAALITPDRMLTRRVAAQLDRWGIVPDDSAGEPLRQTAAGRLIRHVAALMGERLTAEALVTLLKHPLVHAGELRNQHLLWVRELEVSLRRFGPPFPDPTSLARWAARQHEKRPKAADPRPWAEWVATWCLGLEDASERPLADRVALLLDRVSGLGVGSDGCHTTMRVWTDPDGRKARRALYALMAEADAAADMAPPAFRAVLDSVLGEEHRDPVVPDERVMVWGTLEARVQGADLVILGALNDGTWPELPAPDPWLNRRMRAQAGLLMPERRIGLAAHDFQQAIAAPEVVLSRARRDADAETVPSRWLNRLVNLMDGLPAQDGPGALDAMRQRGAHWVRLAQAMDRPAAKVPSAPRPSPRPPVPHRPRELPVTDIERLIRDPYAIYAKRILDLRPLDPLHRDPDPRDRGSVLHEVMERFIPDFAALPPEDRAARLVDTAREVLERKVPWPVARRLWQGRLARVAETFVTQEETRHAGARPAGYEQKGALHLPEVDFTVSGRADRIDVTEGGDLVIYDYKTGTPPSAKAQEQFNAQLLLLALIAETAGFADIAPAPVLRAAYLGLGNVPATVEAPLDKLPPAEARVRLARLVRHYDDPSMGYTAQKAVQFMDATGDYDHLARAGEWDLSDPTTPEDVGQ